MNALREVLSDGAFVSPSSMKSPRLRSETQIAITIVGLVFCCLVNFVAAAGFWCNARN